MIITTLLYIFATIGVLNTIIAIIFLIYLIVDINNYKEWEYIEGYGFKNIWKNERNGNEEEISGSNQNNSSKC